MIRHDLARDHDEEDRPRTTVLFAHPSAELYGSDRVLLESVSALMDAGHRVVVALPVAGPLGGYLKSRGAQVEDCASPVLRKSALRPRGFVRLLREVARGFREGNALIRRERPVSIYVNTVTIPLWILLARIHRIPVLVHVHEGEGSASTTVKRVLSLPLLFSDRVIANSNFSVGVLSAAFRRLSTTTVVYNGVPGPHSPIHARPILDSALAITYVGRLSPRKGVDIAVAALAILRERGIDANLNLVGAVFPGYEWYERQLHEQVDACAIGGNVTFTGFHPSVWDDIAAGDVVVVPSRSDEPFGNTAVEAILSGRPVVASATSGLIEATAGYHAARTVAPGSAEDLARALLEIRDTWAEVNETAWIDMETARSRHAPVVYRRQIVEIVESMLKR